jgi:hypothetical protein
VTAHMPDAATLEQIRSSGDGPIVLLNVLKYRKPGGRDAFGRYGQITGPLIAEAGGVVIFGGRAGAVLTGLDCEYDDVLIVRFANAERFLGMIESEVYTQQAAPIRAEALEATVWMAMHPFPGFAGEDA